MLLKIFNKKRSPARACGSIYQFGELWKMSNFAVLFVARLHRVTLQRKKDCRL